MKVKVKFRDTEFGLFEPSFTVPVLGSAERFRGIYLDFTANGVPWSQLVLDEAMPRDRMLDDTRSESPVFASANDGMYWIIKRILDPERECGEEIEIKYEGEEMNNMTTTVPAGTDSVTLHIQRDEKCSGELTLRDALLATRSDRPVKVVVNDRVTLPDGRRGLVAWEVSFVAENADTKTHRMDRVARLASATLCDAGALLDDRNVAISSSSSSSDDHYSGTIILTVDANV